MLRHSSTPRPRGWARKSRVELIDDIAPKVRCPVHVVHGTDDRLRTWSIGERLAELTGGRLTLVEQAGHGLAGRDPVLINT